MKSKKIIVLAFNFFALCFTQAAHANPTYKFKPYGRIKATAIYSDQLLSSFSYINPSAPTSAGSNVGLNATNNNVTSFQVAQSRFGADITLDPDVYGNFEFDFIDFGVSSPTTEAKPRLRKAYVGYKINPHHQIQMGQDWDTFSPAVPNILDYVGLYFEAGNTGFMRQQFKWRYTQDKIISELSVGMPGKNPTPVVNDIELETTPALAYRLSYKDIGVSAYHSKINKNNSGQKDVNGINAFAKMNISSNLLFNAEVYAGQNMNEAALLGISHIVANQSLKEYGGYVNLTYLNPKLGDINLNYGFAKISNPDDAGDYNYDAATKKITEEAITLNQVVRLYWNKKIQEGLSLVAEVSYFKTERKFAASDFRSQDGLSTEAGLLLVF